MIQLYNNIVYKYIYFKYYRNACLYLRSCKGLIYATSHIKIILLHI